MTRRRKTALTVLILAGIGLLVPRPPLREGLGFSQRVFDREGRLLRLTLSADEKYRLWVPLSEYSPELIKATLSKEDRWFYRHPGVNPLSLLRAGWTTYWLGERRIGGSTLTMQLARVRYGLKTRSLAGKTVQILRALQIELFYSKARILEAYLNLAPYGGNIEGAAAASVIYFGKSPRRLSAEEAKILSLIPQDPSRKGTILSAREDVRSSRDLPFAAPHFVARLLAEDHGQTGDIHSTLDLDLQMLLESQIREYIRTRSAEGIDNAAGLLIDHRDMKILASVGSADFFNTKIQGQVDGTRAPRSPGSTLKPFVYALGFAQGVITPLALLHDAPTHFGGFSPENFDGKFEGPVSAHDALVRSRNIPAVEVASQLASPDFFDFLRRAGVDLPKGRTYYGLAPVLGGTELSMERLGALYGMLAARGVMRELRVRQDAGTASGRELISPESAYMVLDILGDVPRPRQGFRSEWIRDSMPIFWKTGTSYGFRDAWSAGIFGQYVLVVWLGRFDGSENPALVGATAAAPLFFRIVDALRGRAADSHLLSHARLGRLQEARVCAVSGKTPSPACPHTVRSWVIPGVSPIERCDVHRAVLVDRRTGRRACGKDETHARSEVYEFWPSNMLKIFRKAGIPRKLPPAPAGDCSTFSIADTGAPPRITSPDGSSAYALRIEQSAERAVPLQAVADADARELYWFADESYIGKARSGEPLFWKPSGGRNTIRVVDEHGRSDARTVIVTWVR